jgi:PTS system fructose-specific IIC component
MSLAIQNAATLADLTSPALIVSALRGQGAADAIRELSEALCRDGRVPATRPFCDAVMKREMLASTEMEAGMAFPHARLAEISELSFAVGRSTRPFGWGATGKGSVRLMFLIAVPESGSADYLLLISGLARLSKDRQLVERLLAAESATQALAVLRSVPLRPNPRPGPSKATAAAGSNFPN